MLNKIIKNKIIHDNISPLYYFFPIGLLVFIYNICLVVFNFNVGEYKWPIYLFALFFSIILCLKDFFYKKFIFVCFATLCSFFSIFFFINIINVTNLYYTSVFLLICYLIVIYRFNIFETNIWNIFFYSIYFLLIFEIASKFYYWLEYDNFFWINLSETPYRLNMLNQYFHFFYELIPNFIIKDFSISTIFNFFYILYFIIFLLLITFIILMLTKKDSNYVFLNKYWFVLPIIIFFTESFSTYNFFTKIGGGALLHWQVYVSTIESMQNGGFILWDVPSQYGFLSMILLYLIPFQSAWLKIYILNSTLTLITSLILFKIIWNNRNFAWYLIAFLLTWIMLFVVSAGPSFENSATVPSTGPLRYFWVLLLLYLLFNLKNMNFEKQIIYILPIWLIGFFWSITSAFCVSFIILPYMFYHLFIQGFNIKKTLFYLFLFPFFILIFSLIIVLYYKINLNHFPDFYSFIEYALSFTGDSARVSRDADLDGSILLPVFFWSWILIEMLKTESKQNRFLLLSASFGLWSVCSYAWVVWGNNLEYLLQTYIYIFIIFLCINIINDKNNNILYLSPLFLFLIILCCTNPKFIKHYYDTITHQDYSFKYIEYKEIDDYHNLLTDLDPQNIPVAYVQPGRYWFFNSENSFINKKNNTKIKLQRNYFPTFFSAQALWPLSEKRRYIYSDRWLKRNDFKKGWFINNSNPSQWQKPFDDLTAKLLKDYHIEKIVIKGKLKAKLFVKN